MAMKTPSVGRLRRSGARVQENHFLDTLLSEDLFDFRIPQNRDVIGGDVPGQMFLCAQGVAPVDESDLHTDVAEVERFRDRAVAAAHHHRSFPFEKRSVAGGAVADTPSGQPKFTRDAKAPVTCARSQDDRPGGKSAAVRTHSDGFSRPDLDDLFPLKNLDVFKCVTHYNVHQSLSRHSGEARVVLDDGGCGDLTAKRGPARSQRS